MLPDYRDVHMLLPAYAMTDGAGVRLKRSLGSAELEYLDPFLMLDEFKSDDSRDYAGGFPDHPHRGFETVTYMLAGEFEHKDHLGNHGVLKPGSVQWMTAGRGIVHSEMPLTTSGLVWGFQMWVNLPQTDKMCLPRYQDIEAEQIPEVLREDGTLVRVIAGRAFGSTGPVNGIAVDPTLLDVRIPAGVTMDLPLPVGHNAFVYAYEGRGAVGGDRKEVGIPIGSGMVAVLEDGDTVRLKAGEQGLKLIVGAGRSLGEPVARLGPFVMNTREEVMRAVDDFNRGTFLG